MSKSELVGYARKDDDINVLRLHILKEAIQKAKTVEGRDGTEYCVFIIDIEKIKKMIYDDHPVTSICQLIE